MITLFLSGHYSSHQGIPILLLPFTTIIKPSKIFLYEKKNGFNFLWTAVDHVVNLFSALFIGSLDFHSTCLHFGGVGILPTSWCLDGTLGSSHRLHWGFRRWDFRDHLLSALSNMSKKTKRRLIIVLCQQPTASK